MSMLKRFFFGDFPAWDDPRACRFQRVEVDLDACDGCKLCTMVCPAAVLEMFGEKGRKKVRVVNEGHGCISCNNCHAICENHAIRAVRHYAMNGYYRSEGIGEFQPPRKSVPGPV